MMPRGFNVFAEQWRLSNIVEVIFDFDELLFGAKERIDNRRIEMFAATFQDDFASMFVAECFFVNAFGRQRIVDIGQCGDASADRNLFAGQARWDNLFRQIFRDVSRRYRGPSANIELRDRLAAQHRGFDRR